MKTKGEKIIEILIQKGAELLNKPFGPLQFTKNEEADRLFKLII